MGRAPDDRCGADDLSRHGQRKVVLPEVQHIGAGRPRDVGAVVDGHQPAVPARGVGENLQRRQFAARLQWAERPLADRPLVAQLDDVDAAGQHRIGELGEITAFAAGVGAEVQPSVLQCGAGFVHTATLAASVDVRHGSPEEQD